jgi:ketosteroid isomerase-like protein
MKYATHVLCSLAMLVSASIRGVEGTAADSEFAAIEQKMADALLKGDGPGFGKLVSDDWKIVLTDGKMLTIAQVNEALAGGKLKFRSVKLSDLEVRSYGDTVIVIGVNQTSGSWDLDDFQGKDRFTDVFVRKDGAWKCVASHTSTISDE